MGSILATGTLKKSHGGSRPLNYTICRLYEKHLPLVMTLQEEIIQNLLQPDLLQPFSSDFMKRHMGHQGFVLGAFLRNRLVAFRNVYYPAPGDAEWNLGLDLGLPGKQLTKVANLQMVCVHPLFRGNGLALKMNQTALGMLFEKGTHCNVCATVSPYNLWNLRILLNSGFCICRLKRKYGGKLRYIVYQNLRRSFLVDDRSSVRVRLDDLNTQEKLMAEGYYGIALYRRNCMRRDYPLDAFDLVFKAHWQDNVSPRAPAISPALADARVTNALQSLAY